MTPEVEAVLQKIGWEVVSKCNPFFVASLKSSFERSELVKTDADARKASAEITKTFKLTFNLLQAIRELPEATRRNIAMATVTPQDALTQMTCGEPINVPLLFEDVEGLLWQLMIGLEATESQMSFLGGKPRPGRPKNLRPHEVAFAAAKVYFIGLNDLPTAYFDPVSGRIGGLFGQAVEELFGVLGLGFDALEPCKEATRLLQSLPSEELNALKLMRDPSTRNEVKAIFIKKF